MNHTTFIQYTVDYENRWQAVTRDLGYYALTVEEEAKP